MIDFDDYKKRMNSSDAEKLNSAVMKLRSLTPEARETILFAMESMINCEKLKHTSVGVLATDSDDKDSYELDTSKLEYSLQCKYDELKSLARINSDIRDDNTVLMAVAKILNTGTYLEGAHAICILSKINIIKSKLNPEEFFYSQEIKDEEEE